MLPHLFRLGLDSGSQEILQQDKMDGDTDKGELRRETT
jgi:hypothetical protein